MFLAKPNTLLRLEGLAVFLLALLLYRHQAYSWPLFWSTILLPDVALLAYLFSQKIGSVAYNLTHAKILPALLAGVGLVYSMPLLLALSLIWFMHIGADRVLGYGLKYPRGFKFTHLGVIGRLN
jgi:hypothetical protein